jgi:hypothetical protein
VPVTAKDLKRLLDSFDWDSWNSELREIIEEGYRAVALDQAAREADAHDLEFSPKDPFVERWFTRYLGERITQIDETTRDTLRDELQAAFADGKAQSATELAGNLRDAVSDSAALSPSRALTIARTETAIGYNHGALLAYGQNGIERVEVSDGDGDEECAEADGQIWTLEHAMDDPVAHPNCVRSFSPVVEEVDDSQADEE